MKNPSAPSPSASPIIVGSLLSPTMGRRYFAPRPRSVKKRVGGRTMHTDGIFDVVRTTSGLFAATRVAGARAVLSTSEPVEIRADRGSQPRRSITPYLA